jgi:hypothetical protein
MSCTRMSDPRGEWLRSLLFKGLLLNRGGSRAPLLMDGARTVECVSALPENYLQARSKALERTVERGNSADCPPAPKSLRCG